MSSPTKETAAGGVKKPEFVKEEQQSNIFGDIDKRLSFLLERANKLEDTLNQLHATQHCGDGQDCEEVENENAIEPDIDINEPDDLNPDPEKNEEVDDNVSADNLEKVNLDLHEN